MPGIDFALCSILYNTFTETKPQATNSLVLNRESVGISIVRDSVERWR